MQATGNDGASYVNRADRNGVKRWRRSGASPRRPRASSPAGRRATAAPTTKRSPVAPTVTLTVTPSGVDARIPLNKFNLFNLGRWWRDRLQDAHRYHPVANLRVVPEYRTKKIQIVYDLTKPGDEDAVNEMLADPDDDGNYPVFHRGNGSIVSIDRDASAGGTPTLVRGSVARAQLA